MHAWELPELFKILWKTMGITQVIHAWELPQAIPFGINGLAAIWGVIHAWELPELRMGTPAKNKETARKLLI